MDPFVGGACALASAAIWAFSATFLTIPAQIYGGRATNLFKSSVAAVLFFLTIVAWLGLAAFDLPPGVWAWFVVSGVFGLGIADTAYLSSLKHIGPTLTAIVYQTSGIFTAILGVTLLEETLTAGEIAAIAVVIGGVVLALLAHPPSVGEGRHRMRGALYALIASAFHAIGLVFNKTAFEKLEAFDGTKGLPAAMIAGFGRMGAAAASLLIFGLVTRSLVRQTRLLRDPAGWRSTFVPVFFGTFVAMITMQLSITLMRVGIASVLLSMTPVFTSPVEWWVLKRRPSVLGLVGAVIALVGAYFLAGDR
jgi:drug/metabolite transporter (DMT)-like permease